MRDFDLDDVAVIFGGIALWLVAVTFSAACLAASLQYVPEMQSGNVAAPFFFFALSALTLVAASLFLVLRNRKLFDVKKPWLVMLVVAFVSHLVALLVLTVVNAGEVRQIDVVPPVVGSPEDVDAVVNIVSCVGLAYNWTLFFLAWTVMGYFGYRVFKDYDTMRVWEV